MEVTFCRPVFVVGFDNTMDFTMALKALVKLNISPDIPSMFCYVAESD